MKVTTVSLISLVLFTVAAAAQDQPEWQLNKPYRCANGISYTITRRTGTGYNSMCLYSEAQNDEHVTDVVTRCSQMTGMLQGCTVDGAPGGPQSAAAAGDPSGDVNNMRYDCANGSAMMTVFNCQQQGGQDYCLVRLESGGELIAQAPKPRNEIEAQVKSCKVLPQFNPPYLAEFPSPHHVVQGILAGNPRDNVTRAIGAFYQLQEILKVLAGARAAGGLTPDEKKFIDDYARTQSQLADAASKKFPGENFDVERNPFRYSVNDPKFGFEGIPVWANLLTPAAQAQFARLVGRNDARYAAAAGEQRQRAMQQADNDLKVAQADATARKDPGSVAVRHCIESGRSDMECLGEGMKIGAMNLMGGNPMKGLVPDTPVGLRVTGVYASRDLSLMFTQDHVIVQCGTLVDQPQFYTVQRNEDRVVIQIPISPKPVTLTYKNDGQLVGPGPVDVAGQVVVGRAVDNPTTGYEMQTNTTTTQRQIDAGEVRNYSADQVHQNGMEYSVDQQTTSTSWTPTTQHNYTVPTAPKTERCNAGLMPARAATASVSGALTTLLGSQASRSSNFAPGLRLNGTYVAAGGFKVEFRDDSATLECGEARNAEGYTVEAEGGRLVVKFDNKTGPLAMTLEPDGRISGPASLDVAGRKLIGGDDVHSFVPRNEHCAVGTLSPVRQW